MLPLIFLLKVVELVKISKISLIFFKQSFSNPQKFANLNKDENAFSHYPDKLLTSCMHYLFSLMLVVVLNLSEQEKIWRKFVDLGDNKEGDALTHYV
jgi:hypothetical protein